MQVDDALDVQSQPADVLDQVSRKCRVVELRFFSGPGVEETAVVLDVSTDTVSRNWAFTKTWLFRELRDGRSSAR